jgi:hypothetical protein
MTAVRVATLLGVLGTPAVFAPVLVRGRSRIPRPIWRVLAVIICVVPLFASWTLVGIARPLGVILVTILGGIVMLKAIDWLCKPRQENDLLRVWLALTFWPTLEIEEVAIPIQGMRRRITLALRRLSTGTVRVVSGLALTATGQSLDMPQFGFWLDGTFKALEIYLLGGGVNDFLVATLNLAGYRASDPFRYPILAHSVLDFWSRYNVWIHRWLKKHIFDPIGSRRRRPVLGILAVFAVSGLLHEYVIFPVAPDLLGWQSAFFGLHGLGAVGGGWLGHKYRAITGRRAPRPLAIAATLSFVLATAPIFVHCLDRVGDLHRDLGAWVLERVRHDAAGRVGPGKSMRIYPWASGTNRSFASSTSCGDRIGCKEVDGTPSRVGRAISMGTSRPWRTRSTV